MSKHLPGRLGNPDLTILDDPRLDERIRAVMAATAGIIPPVEPPPPAITKPRSNTAERSKSSTKPRTPNSSPPSPISIRSSDAPRRSKASMAMTSRSTSTNLPSVRVRRLAWFIPTAAAWS